MFILPIILNITESETVSFAITRELTRMEIFIIQEVIEDHRDDFTFKDICSMIKGSLSGMNILAKTETLEPFFV